MKYIKGMLFLFCCAGLNGCAFFYVIKQGAYQLKLLSEAEPIEMALRDGKLDPQIRRKLNLISDVRQFGAHKLGLNVKKNYKDVALDWHHAIHTVSASDPLRFHPYHWWFPIIGSVPYKGFFELADAQALERSLRDQGFDTQIGRIQGYSTLGFFSDPIWPSMLKLSDHALIELLLHELAHATVYFPNQTPFNETFANFIGKRGTRAYLEQRFGKKSQQLLALEVYNQNLIHYHEFFHDLYQRLERLYSSDISDRDKSLEKSRKLADAEERYHSHTMSQEFKIVDWGRINNAYLLSFKRYNYDGEVFEALFMAVDQDFAAFIKEVSYYGRGDEPFEAMANRVVELKARPR